MAYTGTLPPKLPRDAIALPSPRPSLETSSAVRDTGEQGAIPYFFVLVFSFFVLARPQDFIKPLRGIQFAMLFGSAAIFTWALGVFTGQIKFRKSKEMKLMLWLTFWFVLGVPFCYWPSNAVHNLMAEWLKIIMIFLVLTQTVTSTKRLRHLLWLMFLSGLLATGVSLMLGSYTIEQGNENRFLGMSRGFFFGNYLGVAAAVLLPYIAAMLIHTRSFLKQLILIGCFATMVISLVLTASRSNLISIIVSLILVWAMVLKDSLKAKLIGICFAFGLVLAIAFAPLAFWQRVGTLWGSEVSTASAAGDEAEESSQQRREVLIRSLEITARRPIFGLGVGNFPTYSGNVARVLLGTHNTFTQVSSEGGIPALIMFVMLLTTGITRMRRMARRCEGRPELAQEKSLASATVVSLVSFMVGACFAHLAWEFYLYYLAVIGVSLQTIYTLRTGQSLETPDAGGGESSDNGGDKRNGHGWRRFRNAVGEART